MSVKKKLATLERGNDSFSVYSTKLKKLLEEFSSLQDKLESACKCGAYKQSLDEIHNSNYVDQFLMGLGEAYEIVVSIILLMKSMRWWHKLKYLTRRRRRHLDIVLTAVRQGMCKKHARTRLAIRIGSKGKLVKENKKFMAELIQEELKKLMRGKHAKSPVNASFFADFAGNSVNTFHDYFDYKNDIPRWIVDSGASSHVTGNLSLRTEIHEPIKHNIVQLLVGVNKKVKFVGKVHLAGGVTLTNLLYVLDFKYNLILVSKLVANSDVEVVFHAFDCVMQDPRTKKHLAFGKLINNLYVLEEKNSGVLEFTKSLTCKIGDSSSSSALCGMLV
ncbi:Integrase, catalytic core [Senna tora]|uniref:Integrase, catalytic core n=1 Tax=Senna tora TaxID=362788 RepID=A0A834SQT1_9FABA|nr:Integrase, catalytic core [Senna tora]